MFLKIYIFLFILIYIRGVSWILGLTAPPSREFDTANFKLLPAIFLNQGLKHEKHEETKRKIGGEIKIFTAKWLKSKVVTAKYSIFDGEYRLSGNPDLNSYLENEISPLTEDWTSHCAGTSAKLWSLIRYICVHMNV